MTIVEGNSEVGVHVDQAWQKRHAKKSGHFRLTDLTHRHHIDDLIALNAHGKTFPHLSGNRIKHSVRHKDVTTHGIIKPRPTFNVSPWGDQFCRAFRIQDYRCMRPDSLREFRYSAAVPAADRIHLAQIPTPLEHAPRLSEAWGADIWIKRDDLTGFGLSGNKVRKLEYHLKAALDTGATTVITCGATQSNHARTTALAAARLGLRTILYLRTPDGQPPNEVWGNHLLQLLAGAECRFVTPAEYDERDSIMEAAAKDVGNAWVMPEGASDALGSKGFANAAAELADQVKDFRGTFTVWHASMSGGTTAGLVLGARDARLDVDIIGCAVGDSAEGISDRVRLILGEGVPNVKWSINDNHIGGGYGVISDAEMAVQAEATRLTGLLFDPTYTGKSIYGLYREIKKGTFGPQDTIVFWHTGGGFATFAYDWSQFV